MSVGEGDMPPLLDKAKARGDTLQEKGSHSAFPCSLCMLFALLITV